jgi:tetratricopeptide (TPR) repeat protein
MLTIISLSIIGLAIIIILFIIIKKFPALAILDAANIPGEKETKFKEQIIKARVERDVARWGGFFGRIWLFLSKRLSTSLKSQQANLKKIKTNYRVSGKMSAVERQKKIKELLAGVQELSEKEDEAGTEEKLLEIINLDRKNLGAFFRLGELYASQKKWSEASQTLGYALHLARQAFNQEEAGEITLQEIYFVLAEVEKEAGNLEISLENIREALELEPNNPRYLDLILDLSIMRKDKELASESWSRLATVNPENNKLAEWQEIIEKL